MTEIEYILLQRRPIRLPKSLFETCLQYVASHLANYDPNVQEGTPSSSNLMEGEKSISEFDVNPFDVLPLHLSEHIINALRVNSWLDIKHRPLLISTDTKKLDISFLSRKGNYENTANSFLQLAAIRCPQLTDLCMRDITKCSSNYYKFLPLFKHLQILIVPHSGFDDLGLHILGVHCRFLRELDVTVCINVTDDGIEGLCGGPYEFEKNVLMGHSGQCKSLQRLSIMGTKVTQKGVQMALRHLSCLKVFESFNVIQALAATHRQYQANAIRPKYSSLIHLDFVEPKSYSPENLPPVVPPEIGDFRLAASLCPYVTHLLIDDQKSVKITDYDILGLMELKSLSKLQIWCQRTITFDGGLAPVLKVIGSSLKILVLIAVEISIRLGCLVEYCPNLEELCIKECSLSSSNWLEEDELSRRVERPSAGKRMKPDFVWNYLKKFELQGDIPTEPLLLALSSSPALEYIEIVGCETLNDDVLLRAFYHHSFNSLEHLDLKLAGSVTMRGIELFLNRGMPLDRIVIQYAPDVIQEDIDI